MMLIITHVAQVWKQMESMLYGHIQTESFYKDIAKDVETKFDTSGYLKDDNRPPITGKNKKVIGMIKDELGGKIMRKCVALRQKICNAYRKTEKYKKMCVAAVGLTFDKYKVSLTNPPN